VPLAAPTLTTADSTTSGAGLPQNLAPVQPGVSCSASTLHEQPFNTHQQCGCTVLQFRPAMRRIVAPAQDALIAFHAEDKPGSCCCSVRRAPPLAVKKMAGGVAAGQPVSSPTGPTVSGAPVKENWSKSGCALRSPGSERVLQRAPMSCSSHFLSSFPGDHVLQSSYTAAMLTTPQRNLQHRRFCGPASSLATHNWCRRCSWVSFQT
jgi:hypothetical protein